MSEARDGHTEVLFDSPELKAIVFHDSAEAVVQMLWNTEFPNSVKAALVEREYRWLEDEYITVSDEGDPLQTFVFSQDGDF